jgi:hypothetical protein
MENIIYSQTNTAIEWSITAVRTRNQDGRDIVVQLDWTMLGTRLDSINKPVSALKNGTIVLDYNADKFTDFSKLTQGKLINWVNVHLGVDKINELRKEINIELDSHLLTEQTVPS